MAKAITIDFYHHVQKEKKKPIIVGVAFSFQKHHKLPVSKKDFKLDYVITEMGII